MKKIDVEKFDTLPTMSWKELKDNFEPNTLKDRKNRDVSDLKASILAQGFIAPLFIWVEGKYIADGAGRHLALSMLEYEGYEIPDIPYLPIHAKNKKEAKRKVLSYSSKYGKETHESIAEFLLDMDEIDISFINIDGFDMETIEVAPPGGKEINIENMRGETKHQHTCPKCHFEFSTAK